MKRSLLALLLAPAIAQMLGCVAELSGVSSAGSGGATDLSGSPAPGAADGASGGSNGTGGATTLAPAGTNGTPATAIPTPSSGSGGGAATGGRTGTGGAPAPVGGGVTTGTAGGAGTASGGTATCPTDTVPTVVQSMLNGKCLGCHGSTPLPGAISLRTFADLTGPSRTDPTKTAAAMMLSRVQNTAAPMPPAGGTPASAAEVTALRDWVNASYKSPCPTTTTTTGGGTTAGGTTGTGTGTVPVTGPGSTPGVVLPPPAGPDPFASGAICTSKTTASGGESATMAPGQACVNCHRNGGGGDEGESEAPIFSIAGTLYPTGHEPNNCNGMSGSSGARIVITGADGVVLTLTPNSAGNFTSQANVRAPFRAKVTYQGRERLMVAAQTNGDCNACHTQNGASMAPGRIVLP